MFPIEIHDKESILVFNNDLNVKWSLNENEREGLHSTGSILSALVIVVAAVNEGDGDGVNKLLQESVENQHDNSISSTINTSSSVSSISNDDTNNIGDSNKGNNNETSISETITTDSENAVNSHDSDAIIHQNKSIDIDNNSNNSDGPY